MNIKERTKQILSQIQKIRVGSRTSCQEVENYLYYQHLKVSEDQYFLYVCGMCGRVKSDVPQSFKRAFKTMSQLEKAEFYLLNCKSVESIVNSESQNCAGSMSKVGCFKKTKSRQPKKLSLSIKSDSIFKKWTSVHAELLQNERIIRIGQYKIQLDLHYYLLRKSKAKSPVSLILEATQPAPLGNTVRISCVDYDFSQYFNTINEIWELAQFEHIKEMMPIENIAARGSTGYPIRLMKPQSLMHEPNRYSGEYRELMKSLPPMAEIQKGKFQEVKLRHIVTTKKYAMEIIKTFGSFEKFKQENFGEFYQRKGLRVRKIVEFNSYQKNTEFVESLIKNLSLTKKRKTTLQDTKIIQTYKNLDIQIVKQFHHFGEEDVQFVFERQSFSHHGATYILQKSIQPQAGSPKMSSILRANIYHCIWRIRQKGDNLQILVQAKIDYRKNDKSFQIQTIRRFTNSYIGELGTLIQQIVNTKSIDFNQQQSLSQIGDSELQSFYTIPGSMIDDGDVRINCEIMDQEQTKGKSQCSIDDMSDIQQHKKQDEGREVKLLKCKHIKQAKKKGEKQLMISSKGHCLWEDEWQVKQNGDLVNINKQKIDTQSSVLKLVLKRIGRNLLTGKSILNISLPIQIFGTDSNLQRLAKGYIYAPIFLQKAALQTDPVQRIKQIVSFQLGFSLSYIKMQKPFNPILGQTYQGLIDGCPVYGEQISHHPPISSLLMIGRGYRVYGSFQAKVQMGMNSASGINEGFNYVQFQDKGKKSVIKVSCPPGEISGLVYGDRKLSLVKKSYCIDQQNLLVCEISWGKNGSIGDAHCKQNDYFYGKIVKVKDSNSLSNYKNLKSKQIQKQLGTISGRFTQQLLFNNKEVVFNIQQETPYLMKDYSPCLLSDARNRKDMMYRKLNDFAMAQQAKEQMQEDQRRDRKLRGGH